MIKILAIDDNADNLAVIQALLSDAFPGTKIILTQTGKEGIELAKKELPDVILLDLVMPIMDGYEVCSILKANNDLKHIPVIILTAIKADTNSRIRALDNGADAFLQKPLEEAELRAQISAMIRIKKSESLNRSETLRLSNLVKERTRVLENELVERGKIEENLQKTLSKLELSKVASLNLLEDLKTEIKKREIKEKALQENEIKLSEAQRIASLGSWTWDKESNTLAWSDQMFNMLKWDKTRALPDFINPVGLFTNESFKHIQNYHNKLLYSGTSYIDDFELIRADGRHIWTTCHGEAVYDESGTLTGVQGTFLDITSRKLIEQSLEKSEKRYRTLFENMLNGFAYCKMLYEDDTPVDFIYLLVNKAFEKMTGLESVTGKNISDLIPGIKNDNPEIFEIYGRVSRTGKPEWFETYLPSLDKWFSVSVYCPARDYFIAIFNTITDQKKSELAIRKSETKYRQLFEEMIDGFALHEIILNENGEGVDYRFIEVNPAFCNITGLDSKHIIGKSVLEVMPETEKSWIEKYSKVALTGKAERFENYSSAMHKYFEVIAYSPEKEYFATIFKDITKQKQLNEEETLRNHINEIFAVAIGDEVYEKILAYALNYIGAEFGSFGFFEEDGNFIAPYIVGNILGDQNSFPEKVLLTDRNKFQTIWGKAKNKKKSQFENDGPFNIPDGIAKINNRAIIPLIFKDQLISSFYLANKIGGFSEWDIFKLEYFASLVAPILFVRLERDSHERRRNLAEMELQKLSRAVEFSPVTVVITNPDGIIEYVNPKFTEITGYTFKEAIGKNPRILKSGLTPDSEYKSLWETITKGETWRGEFHNKKKNNELYLEDASISPIYNTSGEITHFIAVKEDITEKKSNQQRIRSLKEFYEQILESIHDGIYVTDKDDVIYYTNSRMSEIAGVTRSEIEGKQVLKDFPESTLKYFRPVYLQAKKTHQPIEYESIPVQTPSHKETFQSGIMVPILVKGKYDGMLCTVQDTTQKKRADIEIKKSKEELRKLTEHIQSVREEEKKNIARDIHDDLGQKLAALKMDLFWITSKFDKEGKLKEKIDEMHSIINESVESIHRIIKDLRPPVLDDLGLFEAIEWLVKEVNKRSNIQFNLDVNCQEPEFTGKVQQEVFRVIQEALTNIVRHSLAHNAKVHIHELNNNLLIQITDNGIGIPSLEIENSESFGLMGMKERITSIQGKINIKSKIGKGSTIEFSVPISKNDLS